jgi:transposase
MRGNDSRQSAMFSYISPEARVPKKHPLRPIRNMIDRALKELSPLFDEIYSNTGRPSIPPEQLLRAIFLQILYSIRGERQLVEQLDYNLLFRWFVGLSMDDEIWNHSVFSKNRDRFLCSEVAVEFFERILAQAREAKLLSEEHFTVDGTMIEAWASHKSFQPKDDEDKGPKDFHGDKRTNATHQSKTDPDAKLYKKGRGKEAKLAYLGHALIENKNSIVVGGCATRATGTAEREAATELISKIPGSHRITLGADKGYDTRSFVKELRELNVTPHVAQKKHSAIDSRTTRHESYAKSIHARKRVEKVFGWVKQTGLIGKVKQRGVERVDQLMLFAFTAYNLVRLRNLGLGTP